MKPYAERRVFSPAARRAFTEATSMVEFYLPTYWERNETGRYAPVTVPVTVEPDHSIRELRCHELVRAVGGILGLVPVDGTYGAVEHSWLVPRKEQGWLLDVYAVGRLPQVQLVDTTSLLPEFKLFQAGAPRLDLDHALIGALWACLDSEAYSALRADACRE